MRLLAVILGVLLILTILWEAFETIILPRRVTRKLRFTFVFYRTVWVAFVLVIKRVRNVKRRETYLAIFGPLSLFILLILWATGLILGYALIQWGFELKLNAAETSLHFGSYVYFSGVTFFTLGYGDLAPLYPLGRALAVIEAATGPGLLAMVVSYLPVLYQSFSRREVSISLLDARAGSPSSAAELLRRHSVNDNMDDMRQLLHEWERWAAELLESHLSYPVLCYFRSQHDNQSWLGALTTVLDTCALVMVGIDGAPTWQARLTFAMARHAVVDLAQIFRTAPAKHQVCEGRLSPTELARLRGILQKNGIDLRDGEEAQKQLTALRMMYEPYVFALSEFLLMRLPPWILPPDSIDNWKTSAWGRIQ